MNEAEENRLQFIANEISLGLTFVESARLSFSMDHGEHGRSAQAKGEAAYSGALRFLERESGTEAERLRSELARLRMSLDSLASGS